MNKDQSLPAWGAWIEIRSSAIYGSSTTSLPAWGAWIEIPITAPKIKPFRVAPRMGSVD